MPIEIIDIAGDALTRGKIYGAQRRSQIQACMTDWLDSLRPAGLADPRSYIAAMLRDTDFVPAIRAHAPELLEEVHGIAAGADQEPDLVLAAQLMDEEWAYRSTFLPVTDGTQKCSSVAIASCKGTTWIGQNMDLGGYTDGHQVALRIATQGAEPGALIFTMGGMIALLGVNTHGVAVCVNSLPQLPFARQGLPVAFVIRKLLQTHNLAEAVKVVHELPHATGQHYLLADSAGIRSFEASPAGVVEYHSPDPSRVLHTNHPLTDATLGPAVTWDQTNTIARLSSLTKRLMQGEPGLDAIKAALSASDDPNNPVCRVPNTGPASPLTGMIGFTTGSMISILQQGSTTVESWISAGPPCLRGYTPVDLRSRSG